MTDVTPETYTRKQLAAKFQYGERRTKTLWKSILATIPAEEMRPEYKTRLPIHIVNKYLSK